MTTHDEPGHRDEAAPRTAARTPRPHAGTWNTRVEPLREASVVRHDPFAALGHESSRHGQAAGAHALHDHPERPLDHAPEHGPVRSLWPHADEAGEPVDGTPRTAWQPHVAWRPTPSVPFPRPAPTTEQDPPGWG